MTPGNKTAGFRSIITTFKLLILPYWKSEDKYSAGILLSLVIALNIGFVYINVLMNKWSGSFYDALQSLDTSGFKTLLFTFTFYVVILIITFLAKDYTEDFLAFHWRNWMTKKFVNRWFYNKAFYKSLQTDSSIDNPDQRISQDIASFTSRILGLGIHFLSSVINLISFSFILWSLSPVLSIPLGEGNSFSIPGYMLWLTLLYCGIATFTIFKIGKPLIKLDYTKEITESNYRYSLMRIIERKDEVALLNGEKDEMHQLDKKFHAIKDNYFNILFRHVYISSAQNIFGNAATIFPMLAASPSFFSGAITLGTLMQISNSFTHVQSALMVFAGSYQNIASISAMANRLKQFHESTDINNIQTDLNIIIDNAFLEAKNLTLYKPNKTTPLVNVNFSLRTGDRLMIKGASGIGKTTLVKTIAGIWPHATGEITRPDMLEIMPQKPYFPVGSLKEAILYGNNNTDIADNDILILLSKFKLSNLSQELKTIADWNAKLSLGEQQRLSIIRIILIKPKWLILDEPTASLDLENQMRSIHALFNALPETAILTISHSTSLEVFHDSVLLIGVENKGAVVPFVPEEVPVF